jgi:hypothetical protein
VHDYYHFCRLERGLSAAEQRAVDQWTGELAADLATTRGALGHNLSRGLGVVKGLGRTKHMRKGASAFGVGAK